MFHPKFVNFCKSLTCIRFDSSRKKVQSWPFSCILSGRLNPTFKTSVRDKAVWGPRRLAIAALTLVLFGASRPAFAQGPTKLDADLQSRATAGSALRTSRVIVTLAPGGSLPAAVQRYDRTGKLSTINGHVLDVPDSLLTALSTNANVTHVHGDRSVHASNFRTSIASGAFFARMSAFFSARTLLTRENNGFIIGLIMGTLLFMLIGRAVLWIAPFVLAGLILWLGEPTSKIAPVT